MFGASWDHTTDAQEDANPIFFALKAPGFGSARQNILKIVRHYPQEFVHVEERTTANKNAEFSRGKASTGNSGKTFDARSERAGSAFSYPLTDDQCREAIDAIKKKPKCMQSIMAALSFTLPATRAKVRKEQLTSKEKASSLSWLWFLMQIA